MGKAKRLGVGTRDSGLAIEYIRTRKVVRLLGWSRREPIEPVEIPLGQLCRQLGIDPNDVGAPRHYLLFAGSHRRPGGGLRDLVGTYHSEEKAWDAFRGLRQGHPSVGGWAQLASIDGLGQLNHLAWFGLHAAPEAPRAARRHGGGDETAYLRAVTPS